MVKALLIKECEIPIRELFWAPRFANCDSKGVCLKKSLQNLRISTETIWAV